MNNNIENCIQSAFAKIDHCYNKDFHILGELIQKRIFDNNIASFDEDQEAVIIEACQEAFRACNILIQAYVNTSILEIIPQLKKDIISELTNLQVKGDQ